MIRQPRLGETFRRLADEGLDSFYRGSLAADIADDLLLVGSPLTGLDLAGNQAVSAASLYVDVSCGRLHNLAPPTQGISSLMILAMFDRIQNKVLNSVDHIHALVEATKLAFLDRALSIQRDQFDAGSVSLLLDRDYLDRLSDRIDFKSALPWPHTGERGDTVWLGVMDQYGNAVSMIQSIFFEFGSGVVLPKTGILWQNRGSSFALKANTGGRLLKPNHKPFHTLNPAYAEFNGGRRMVYGTMGGEGQPQTQAAIFTRYAYQNMPLQEAVSAPRWLLGKTWGEDSADLKLEGNFLDHVVGALRALGHRCAVIDPFNSFIGHAGALVSTANTIEGASPPAVRRRCSGVVTNAACQGNACDALEMAGHRQ